MRLFNLIAVFFACLISPVLSASDNPTTTVHWDKYSLMVEGKREFIYSAEFHYPRLPVPEMWLDVFQKFRAEGFNAISVYFFWSYHSASKGVYDFETSGKDIQKLFDYAKQAGLWVIARPGPYINAETNAGGLALYLSDGSGGKLRTGDETYHKAWLPWITYLGAILEKNQIDHGGPLILYQVENELQETTHLANNTLVIYMEQLEAAFKDAGLLIPSTHNEKGMRSMSWSTDYEDVGGAVDVYALDSYPGGLSCTDPSAGFHVVRDYYQWFQNYSFTQPEYLAEFEGGYLLNWGGEFYDDCASELSPEFADVYYKNNVAQKTTLQNLYMAFGGTNWGNLGAPVVYMSYDYSAPLRETREIRDKMKQTKLIGLFTRVSKDLLTTEMEGNGTGYAVSDSSIYTFALRNPTTKAGFYTFQKNNTGSTASTTFSVYANTSAGPITIPNVTLDGRQSKILVTDYSFGKHTLLYSSAEVLSYGAFDVDVLVLYLSKGQVGKFAFKGSASTSFKTYGAASNFSFSIVNGTVTYTYNQAAGVTAVDFSSGALIYLLDRETAWNFHAPTTVNSPSIESHQQIFVLGPYLVRSAKIAGSSVYVTGDIANETSIEVRTSSQVSTIFWNNKRLATTRTAYGSLQAQIATPYLQLSLPVLSDWKTMNSLPEKEPTYDDSHWVVCNKTTTLSPYTAITLPVLFASDYGFYTGAKIYRARFATANAISVNLTASNGVAAGWSAWLNGEFLTSHPGNATVGINSLSIPLPRDALSKNSSANLLTVLVDYTGHDETSTSSGVENPRGLLGATITGSSFTSWKIQGNAGGSANIDPVRGPMNEGGLHGERLGWHLPGFNTAAWKTGSPVTGIMSADVQWYTTTFDINIPSGWDVPLGLELASPSGTVAIVEAWINGYLFAKYVPHLGPQTRFPVPPGILDIQGENTIAVSVWAMEKAEASVSVQIIEYARYESGFELGFAGGASLRPRWNAGREKYS